MDKDEFTWHWDPPTLIDHGGEDEEKEVWTDSMSESQGIFSHLSFHIYIQEPAHINVQKGVWPSLAPHTHNFAKVSPPHVPHAQFCNF